jgi:RecA-family ATPase
MRLLQSAKNYKVNENGQNYKNYRKKLIAKFPRPIAKDMMAYLWRSSKSNSEFVNKLRSYANRAGYTVNENSLKGIMSRRATTRAGTKRGRNAETERMYLVNNEAWYNINGTNVTNKINANNWVRTNNNNVTPLVKNHTNATNVKTFKRKVANFNSARAARARKM